MIGIMNWGAYIAAHRISAAVLADRKANDGPERSVAWSDEDCITMAIEAARRCLKDHPRQNIDLVIFATTSHPYDEKQGAALIAAALGLPKDVRTVDISSSLRSGLQALALANDAISSGNADHALVVVSDCRQGAPGSELERSGGDGAAAFLIGKNKVVAQISAVASHSEEIQDSWRRNGDRFVHSWEDRFVSQYGISEPIIAAGRKLPEPITQRIWATSAPNLRLAGGVNKALKADANDAATTLLQKAGYCGAAHVPLLLVAALDGAQVGQEIALVAHGDGAEAILLKVAANAASSEFLQTLSYRIAIPNQRVWRKARGLDFSEYPSIDDQGISATIHYRERTANIRLEGQKCQCGEPQFPKGRVCIRCGQKDSYTPVDFSEAGASLITYTLDAFFPSPSPPTIIGVVQVNEGPRIYMQVTEIDPKELKLGMQLSFVFRRIHDAGKRPNYFWKAVPERNVA